MKFKSHDGKVYTITTYRTKSSQRNLTLFLLIKITYYKIKVLNTA